MPLSEHEERILAEIERQLASEDPRFRSADRRRLLPLQAWSRSARIRLAAVLGVLGVAGVLSLRWVLGLAAVGMVLLFGAIVLAASAMREPVVPPSGEDERRPGHR